MCTVTSCHACNNVLRKQSFSEMHFSTPGVFINQLSLNLSSFMKIEAVQSSVLNGTHEVTVHTNRVCSVLDLYMVLVARD